MLVALALLLQTPPVLLNPVEGASATYQGEMSLSTAGRTAKLTFTRHLEYTDVAASSFTLGTTLRNVVLKLGNQTVPADDSPTAKLAMGKDGSIDFEKSEGLDTTARLDILTFRFVPLPAEGGKQTATLKGDGAEIPDQKIESQYLGPRKGNFGYRQKGTAGEMTWETEFTIKADGTVVEAKTKCKNFPAPDSDLKVSGSGKITLKEA